MRKILNLLFAITFLFNALNIIGFLELFFSESVGRLIPYLNISFLLAGSVLSLKIKNRDKFPLLLVLWYFFFLFYYGIGMIANVRHNFEAPFFKTLVPIFYFIGFSLYLGRKENRKFFGQVVIWTFSISNLFLIYFHKINFSLDHEGLTDYTLDRAGGMYGDANNAAVVCLLSIAFIEMLVSPKSRFQKILKYLGIAIAIYALILTFSKTGFLVLLFVLLLLYHKHVKPSQVIAILVGLPVTIYFIIITALNSPSLSVVQKARIHDIINILTLNTSEVSYSSRDVLLENMLGYILQNPLWGNGVYFSTYIRGHNTIVGVWADAGVFVFMFFLFLLSSFIFKAIIQPNLPLKWFALSVLVVLCIFMMTLQTIINQGYLIVLFVFLSYIMANSKKENNYLFVRGQTP